MLFLPKSVKFRKCFSEKFAGITLLFQKRTMRSDDVKNNANLEAEDFSNQISNMNSYQKSNQCFNENSNQCFNENFSQNSNENSNENSNIYGTAGATTDCENQKRQFRSQDWQTELKSNWLKVIKQTIISYRLQILGIILANLSGVIFTVNNGLIQLMKLDFSEIMLVRGTVQIILMTIILVTNGYSILPKIEEKTLKVRLLTIIQGTKEI